MGAYRDPQGQHSRLGHQSALLADCQNDPLTQLVETVGSAAQIPSLVVKSLALAYRPYLCIGLMALAHQDQEAFRLLKEA